MKISLTEQEIIQGSLTGIMRQADSVCNGRKPRFPEKYPGELLLNHQFGALAEIAFCKVVDRYYSPTVNTFHVPDVGTDIEIRYSNTGKLKVREDDNDVYCVLMSGNLPVFEYHGWIWCDDAKKDGWKRDYGNFGVPAYFVPIEYLSKDKMTNTQEQRNE